MLWKGRRESENVEDRRRFGAGSVGVGGLIFGAIIYYLMGGNPLVYLTQNIDKIQASSPLSSSPQKENDEEKRFVSVVLADTEDVWNSLFQEKGQRYQEPSLVLFSQQVQSACGLASSAVGPFYCPADKKVYLDLDFFRQLSQSLGAKGDFATAYVIAHEVGHHVQNLFGINKDFHQKQQAMDERQRNRLSVQMELQADCFSGLWAKQTQTSKNALESNDIEEALGAASAVGDDRLQKRSQGQVVPDSFTHGSSSQRVHAFSQGYQSGRLETCLDNYSLH